MVSFRVQTLFYFVLLATHSVSFFHVPQPVRRSLASRRKVEERSGEWSSTSLQSEFITNIWGKKPFLLRGAFSHFSIGRYLCREDVIRLAQSKQPVSRFVTDAQFVQYGPMSENIFNVDNGSQWMLLVNDMERFVPDMHELKDAFRCFPGWCHDDVMVSCGSPGSTIGAHVDSYDVFLINVAGIRRWEISATPLSHIDEASSLKSSDCPLRVLKESKFKITHSFLLEQGDMLYLPPRIPHRGTSLTGDTITASIGFRIPTIKDMIPYAYSQLFDKISESEDRIKVRHLSNGIEGRIDGEIFAEVKEDIQRLQHGAESNNTSFNQWFGKFVTTPQRLKPQVIEDWKERAAIWPVIAEILLQDLNVSSKVLYRKLGIKCCFAQTSHLRGLLFIDGQDFEYIGKREHRFVQELCGMRHNEDLSLLTSMSVMNKHFLCLLGELLDRGYLYAADRQRPLSGESRCLNALT